jgi:hypothetical protein
MFSQFVDEEEDVLDEPISLDPDMEDSIPLDTIERVPDSTIE